MKNELLALVESLQGEIDPAYFQNSLEAVSQICGFDDVKGMKDHIRLNKFADNLSASLIIGNQIQELQKYVSTASVLHMPTEHGENIRELLYNSIVLLQTLKTQLASAHLYTEAMKEMNSVRKASQSNKADT